MRAMILAAGRGERMRPLTDHTPKPLLPVGGRPLVAWHLDRLARAGLRDVVINHAWLGQQIEDTLGDGRAWGLRLHYSPEPVALETAGGIRQALAWLGNDPFLIINGDVWCDWDPAQAAHARRHLDTHDADAWLLLAPNPDHHPAGDFALADGAPDSTRPVLADGPQRYTYTGIGLYRPVLFAALAPGVRAPLGPLLHAAAADGRLVGQRHAGRWLDIGTPERLTALQQELDAQGAVDPLPAGKGV